MRIMHALLSNPLTLPRRAPPHMQAAIAAFKADKTVKRAFLSASGVEQIKAAGYRTLLSLDGGGMRGLITGPATRAAVAGGGGGTGAWTSTAALYSTGVGL